MRAGGAQAQGQGQRFVTIGTGGVTGVYYAVGGAICRLMNKDRKAHGIRCSVEFDRRLRLQRQHDQGGRARFRPDAVGRAVQLPEGPRRLQGQRLRASCGPCISVHPEPFTVLARKEANVTKFEELKGKRVNVGNPGSGTRASMEELLGALGWKMSDFSLASELQAPTSTGRRSATTRSTPSSTASAIPRPTSRTRPRPAAPSSSRSPGPAVDKLLADKPYYAKATIPGGLYAGNAAADGDLRRARDARHLGQGAGRSRLPARQGDVRQLQRVQVAAPGLRQSRSGQDGQGRQLGAAASRARSATTRRRAG